MVPGGLQGVDPMSKRSCGASTQQGSPGPRPSSPGRADEKLVPCPRRPWPAALARPPPSWPVAAPAPLPLQPCALHAVSRREEAPESRPRLDFWGMTWAGVSGLAWARPSGQWVGPHWGAAPWKGGWTSDGALAGGVVDGLLVRDVVPGGIIDGMGSEFAGR